MLARSTREVLASAFGTRAGVARVVFAGRTPNSAWFHAPRRIIGHNLEPVSASVDRLLWAEDGILLIVSDRDWRRLDGDGIAGLQPVAEVPGWKVSVGPSRIVLR